MLRLPVRRAASHRNSAWTGSEEKPFVVQISWPDVFRFYILFGLLFAGALAILVVLLLRMKVFQAIKLGETA